MKSSDLTEKESKPSLILILLLIWMFYHITSVEPSHFSPQRPLGCLFSLLSSHELTTTVSCSWYVFPCIPSDPCNWSRMQLQDLSTFQSSPKPTHCCVSTTGFVKLPPSDLKHWCWPTKSKTDLYHVLLWHGFLRVQRRHASRLSVLARWCWNKLPLAV